MRANWYTRRGFTLAVTAALLALTACAFTVAAAPGAARGTAARGTAARGTVARGTADTARVVATGQAGGAAATPGWRVVRRFGPEPGGVSGLITAVSAGDAWSVWSGSKFAAIEHWTNGAWRRVALPPGLDGFLRSAVAIGASPAGGAWLFGTDPATVALRLTGGSWILQPIPSWVLRRSAGTVTAVAAVFGPDNVWVFSLGNGAYAAHYNGRTWAKVTMPKVPTDVSAAGPDDIWALGPNTDSVMHWNGTKWATVRLPLLPLRVGEKVSYSNITAVGPANAWLMRTITYKSAPLPSTAMMHWNGKAWLTATSPSDIVGSLVPDGHGGLWADGIDINPGGFWYVYHLADGRWTPFTLPPVVFDHSPEVLTWIPGTRSVWATGTAVDAQGEVDLGVILKYGP